METSLVPIITSIVALIAGVGAGLIALYGKRGEVKAQRDHDNDEQADRLMQRMENENKRLIEQVDRRDSQIAALENQIKFYQELLRTGGERGGAS